jgi:hypothetical protein
MKQPVKLQETKHLHGSSLGVRKPVLSPEEVRKLGIHTGPELILSPHPRKPYKTTPPSSKPATPRS